VSVCLKHVLKTICLPRAKEFIFSIFKFFIDQYTLLMNVEAYSGKKRNIDLAPQILTDMPTCCFLTYAMKNDRDSEGSRFHKGKADFGTF
jgi:hypothetical protein